MRGPVYEPELAKALTDLVRAGHPMIRAAKQLGIHRNTAYHWNKLGLIDIAAARPSRSCAKKLTEAQVAVIRRRLAEGEVQRRIAEAFGVHHSVISRIKSGEMWR